MEKSWKKITQHVLHGRRSCFSIYIYINRNKRWVPTSAGTWEILGRKVRSWLKVCQQGTIGYMYPIFTYHTKSTKCRQIYHTWIPRVCNNKYIIILGILTTRPRHLPQFYRTPSFELFFWRRTSLTRKVLVYLSIFFRGGVGRLLM